MNETAINMLQRAVDDSKRAGGMQTGQPKVKVNRADAERILLLYASIKKEMDLYQEAENERIAAANPEAGDVDKYHYQRLVGFVDFLQRRATEASTVQEQSIADGCDAIRRVLQQRQGERVPGAVRELPDKWRREVGQPDGFSECAKVEINSCADELKRIIESGAEG